ncbi:glycoside hydrolase family protein, partial [Rhodovulum viride]
MVLSDAECEALLRAEVRDYRARLLSHFSAETRARRLPSPRDAAFTSLAFNVGVASAGRSTATRRLNAGDVPGACEALTWWNK